MSDRANRVSLSPQLRRRIDLLRMTSAEVAAHVGQQVRENLALEVIVTDGGVEGCAEDCPGGAAADVCVEEEAGEYSISFPDDRPRLRLRENYLRALLRPETPTEVREFAKVSVRSAMDLLRDIEHRRQCIFRVTEFLVRSQPDVWKAGPEFIKPISLAEAARATGVSRPTVALAVENKLVWTRHGVLELRGFFTGG